jgi:multidrug transporter EmrE-like cation transporter
MSYVDVLCLTFAEIVGDFGYKDFANNGGIKPFAVGTVGYIGVIYFLIKSLQGSQILLVNSAWDGMNALVESLAAIIILGERFDDPRKYLGVVFIIVGLFFLKLPVVNERKFVFPNFFTKKTEQLSVGKIANSQH